MKIILLLLFSAQLALGQSWFGAMLTAQSPVSAECSTSDTTIPHDTFLEGFNGTGYENTFTETETGGTCDQDADSSALTSNKPTGACNEALKVTYNASIAYSQRDNGAAIDIDTVELDVYFSFYIEAIDTGDAIRIFHCGGSANPATSVTYTLQLNEGAGTRTILVDSTVDSAAYTITAGTWVNVLVHLDATVDQCYMEVNGDSANRRTFTRAAVDPRYFSIGAPAAVGAGESGIIWFDLFALNTP